MLDNISKHEKKFEALRSEEEAKSSELSTLKIQYDNKKHVSHSDVRDEDRTLAYELKQDPVDNPVEQDYKRLSDELYQLRIHLD